MKFLFKLFILVLFLLLLLAAAYISLIRPTTDTLLVQSPLQGTKIIKPSEWGIYPERLIPSYVTVVSIPKTLYIQDSTKIELPYAKLITEINDFYIEIQYSLKHNLIENEINILSQKGISYLENFWKNKITGEITSLIQEHIQSNQFLPLEKLRNNILNTLNQQGLSLEFPHYPNMLEYIKLKNQITSSLDKEDYGSKSAQQTLSSLAKQKAIELRKQELSDALSFSTQESLNLKTSGADIHTTFSLLGYLLDTRFPNTPPKRKKTANISGNLDEGSKKQ